MDAPKGFHFCLLTVAPFLNGVPTRVAYTGNGRVNRQDDLV